MRKRIDLPGLVKLDSTIARPDTELTAAWLGIRKKNTAAAMISVAIAIMSNSRIVFFIFYGLLPFLYFHYNMGRTREKEEKSHFLFIDNTI